ncbi:MAG TPA: xanthine dehydrogenase family protein subunit M [Hyphomicrobiaceae bacterium]|nr:xanthine dehydrogenase family protein subunit M [Hyphomicrobiaceae bacterium]
MKPAPFTYHDPRTVEEAVGLLASLDNARVLAGGQSLMPMMNFRYAQPDHLIDLNRIAAMSGISVDKGAIAFGAMTRQREIEFSPQVSEVCPILQAALVHVGHRQTRNRGTIGGSLCHFDPSAELVNCVCVHDGAVLKARSKRGERTLTMSDFAVGYMTHGLAPDEILCSISLPLWSPRHGYAYVEVARRRGDFAIAGVAALIETEGRGGAIKRASLSVAGVCQTPVRPRAAEAALLGERPSQELFEAAASAGEFPEALSDAYVSADYRRHVAQVLIRRALSAAAEKAEERWADA